MSLIMDVLGKTKALATEPVGDRNIEELNQPQGISIKVKTARSSSIWIFALIGIAAIAIGVSLWMLNIYNRSSASPSQTSKASLLTKTPLSVFKETPKNKSILEGIILDDKDPMCLIGGKIFKVGDSWDGKKITAITASQVSLMSAEGIASVLEN